MEDLGGKQDLVLYSLVVCEKHYSDEQHHSTTTSKL